MHQKQVFSWHFATFLAPWDTICLSVQRNNLFSETVCSSAGPISWNGIFLKFGSALLCSRLQSQHFSDNLKYVEKDPLFIFGVKPQAHCHKLTMKILGAFQFTTVLNGWEGRVGSWALVLKTFKKNLLSECRASAASPDILANYTFWHQKLLPSVCQASAVSADILANYTFYQRRIVNGHRENDSFNNAASPAPIHIIILLQSKAKGKSLLEIEANANMTTAQIVRLTFKKSWIVRLSPERFSLLLFKWWPTPKLKNFHEELFMLPRTAFGSTKLSSAMDVHSSEFGWWLLASYCLGVQADWPKESKSEW